MLYRQKYNTFIRIYNDFGYIINKADFTDQITNLSGAMFLKALSRRPKTLQEITTEIAKSFNLSDISEIENDAKIFFRNLEEDGFIVSGDTEEELDKKDIHFSYLHKSGKLSNNYHSPIPLRSEISSQKYLENHLKQNPQLISFQIEITSKCNERCVHCYIPHENKNTDISPELFYKVLKECKDMGVMDITLSGGEPMTHPNFVEFLRATKEAGFYVTVLSNLTLLTDEIINELKSTSLSGVQVSLYSMDAEIHDSITKVPGSFLKTKTAILQLINNNIPVQVSCPTMTENRDSFDEVAKWSNKHGIRAFTDCILMARYDHTIDNLQHRMRLNDMEKVINSIIENDIEYQKLIKNTDFNNINNEDTSEDIICGVGIMSLCMISNGDIYPCAGWQSCICGNVNQSPLCEIWKHSPQISYLRSLRKKDLKQCVSCDKKKFCAVCMVRNANENPDGDPLKINTSICEIAGLNKKVVLEWQQKLNNIP